MSDETARGGEGSGSAVHPTEEELRTEPELARRAVRLAAAFCDWMLIVGPLILAFGWVASGGGVEGAAALMLAPLAISVYQWYLIAKQGQSIGKRWQGIRIVQMDGAPVGFLRGVVLRVWVPAAIAWLDPAGRLIQAIGTGLQTALSSFSITLPIFGVQVNGLLWLVDVLFIFGAGRRCIHDYIAGTKVIIGP
jgi:uncharacterized RDD family membrane protein YckC